MDNLETHEKNGEILIGLTADVVAAYVSNNPIPAGELPNLIADVHAALGRVGGTPEQAQVESADRAREQHEPEEMHALGDRPGPAIVVR